jgi:hypothetical protein
LNKNTISKLVKYETYYKGTQLDPFVVRARTLLDEGNSKAAEELINKLPSESDLLSDIVEQLKGKSVYKSLKRALKESKVEDPTLLAKSLFSLGTHVLIECEKGCKEYRILLPMIYTKIGSLLQEL